MGREIKRVPEGFDWPINRIWPGKMISVCSKIEQYYRDMPDKERCDLCRKYAMLSGFKIESYGCPDFPFTEPPVGPYYQLWETTSEGSPMSPAFETPEELAHWLEDNNTSAFGGETANYQQWLKFIHGPGWAPSAFMRNGELISGVVGLSEGKQP
jgi:hypothetical protein